MRLVSYGSLGKERLGLFVNRTNEEIIDLQWADPTLPNNMMEFLQGDYWEVAEKLRGEIGKIPKEAFVRADSVRIGPPIPNPGMIVCVGLNYKDHADEQGTSYPKKPLLFCKAPTAMSGPCDDIVYPKKVKKLDYEVELAFVIKKEAKDVKSKDAMDYIAGFSTFHDVSARCAQFGDKQWFRGKSFSGFAPMGPALVTPDEIKDHSKLKLVSSVNGEIRQNSNTKNLIHSVEKLLEYISGNMVLRPGDVIATGTPAGVGAFFNPQKFLKKGDLVEMEVEFLGKIANKIV